MKKLIFASKNRGKINEVRNIFSDFNIEITSLLDLNDNLNIEESENTFEANAKKRAAEIFAKYKLPVIADDSGIEVEQLGNRPGVFSARYAGENATDDDNNRKLISELKDFPDPHFAKYVCCAVYCDEENYFAEYGEIKGTITSYAKGINGFGYDPYFIPDGYSKTMAELSPDEKNRISHKAIAFNKLKKKIDMIKE